MMRFDLQRLSAVWAGQRLLLARSLHEALQGAPATLQAHAIQQGLDGSHADAILQQGRRFFEQSVCHRVLTDCHRVPFLRG